MHVKRKCVGKENYFSYRCGEFISLCLRNSGDAAPLPREKGPDVNSVKLTFIPFYTSYRTCFGLSLIYICIFILYLKVYVFQFDVAIFPLSDF